MDNVTLFVYIPQDMRDCPMLIGLTDVGGESYQAISDDLAYDFESTSMIEIVWE
jgi:hypothetical protein